MNITIKKLILSTFITLLLSSYILTKTTFATEDQSALIFEKLQEQKYEKIEKWIKEKTTKDNIDPKDFKEPTKTAISVLLGLTDQEELQNIIKNDKENFQPRCS